jgi:molybdopterin-biosynthesis enzyme MoeA-like protein
MHDLTGRKLTFPQAYFAKWCFSLGIALRRIEVIADDEGEIVEAVQRMSKNYDMVVTSGGIGPTQVISSRLTTSLTIDTATTTSPTSPSPRPSACN